jgi:ribosome-associated protein
MEILRHHRKTSPDDGWNLTDLGNIVIHLMSERSRSFYELERLWSSAAIIHPQPGPGETPSYSSKSSS